MRPYVKCPNSVFVLHFCTFAIKLSFGYFEFYVGRITVSKIIYPDILFRCMTANYFYYAIVNFSRSDPFFSNTGGNDLSSRSFSNFSRSRRPRRFPQSLKFSLRQLRITFFETCSKTALRPRVVGFESDVLSVRTLCRQKYHLSLCNWWQGSPRSGLRADRGPSPTPPLVRGHRTEISALVPKRTSPGSNVDWLRWFSATLSLVWRVVSRKIYDFFSVLCFESFKAWIIFDFNQFVEKIH